jgi:hypothetical protein
MRRRYQRRTAAHYSTSGQSLFGGTGWLFADLLLALAVAFLLATTVGSTPPKIPPKTPPRQNHPSSHPNQLPPLELDPVQIKFTIADPTGLATGSSSAVTAVRATILQEIRGIKSRSAGIVLLFGSDSAYPSYEQVDQDVENILKSISGAGSLFHKETRYVSFLSLGGPNQFSMDVYLFSTTG